MILNPKNFAHNLPRYIDGVYPQNYPEAYQLLLNCSCIVLQQEVKIIYVHKITAMKICELCYSNTQIHLRPNYQCKIFWHSIIENELIITKCQRCEVEILKRLQPTYKCFNCIEQYLDHAPRINLGCEIKVKDHFLCE